MDIVLSLQQIDNFEEWIGALRRAESLVESELQAALSPDSSIGATFHDLFDEIVKTNGLIHQEV